MMKKPIYFLAILSLLNACISSNEQSTTGESKGKHELSPCKDEINPEKTSSLEGETNEKKPTLNFKQLYPVLKNSLLKQVCEKYIVKEDKNSMEVISAESEMFLSSWEWDLLNDPMIIKDIDKDGLLDYTIELTNQGGGCGGQIGQSERWTLFGSKTDRFVWTHLVPYRSKSGQWEKIEN